MKFIIFSLIFSYSFIAYTQTYNTDFIPDSLRKDADVVKRSEEYVLTIKSLSVYTLYEHHVYTILNPAASHYADYITSYDKFCAINSVSATMYDGMGKQLKQARKKDWEDRSAYDGYSLLSDERYKESEFYNNDYPYTVEYEEEDEHNAIQNFPWWMPQASPRMSVQNSKFTIIAPADYIIRYKPVNFTDKPVITEKGDTKTYTWEIKNIPAKRNEKSAPPFREIAASVIFAPSKFEVAGYKGDMSTWENYGKFIYQLIKGRDVLPEELKKKVHELTDDLKTKQEKIFALYNFLQENTRYISVQLGIGGWQPFEASYVAEKKYGDCKALSNFMIALLKEAGITGKYVEIYGGKNSPSIIDDFTFSQGNHVISCVPLDKDTVWLECTSQYGSPGYMGSFTGNRKAILIDESGAKIVNTPVYTSGQNVQCRKINAVMDSAGNINATVDNRYTGLKQDLPHLLMHYKTKEEREKYWNEMFDLPTYQIINSSYKEEKGFIPAVNEELQIRLQNYANITGRRLFATPYFFSGNTERIFSDTARQYDYLIKDAYTSIDTIEIKLPVGYIPESIPKNISLTTQFGSYTSSVKVADEKIICYRHMEQYSGRFPPKEYNEAVKFYDAVYKADKSRVVLLKQE